MGAPLSFWEDSLDCLEWPSLWTAVQPYYSVNTVDPTVPRLLGTQNHRLSLNWYHELDSNQPHTDFQSAALPDELSWQNLGER